MSWTFFSFPRPQWNRVPGFGTSQVSRNEDIFVRSAAMCVCMCLSFSFVRRGVVCCYINCECPSTVWLKPDVLNSGFRAKVKGDVAIASNPFKVSTQKAGQDILLLHPGDSEEISGIPGATAGWCCLWKCERNVRNCGMSIIHTKNIRTRRHTCSTDKQQQQDRQTKTSIFIA
jgi:hypothetical protein